MRRLATDIRALVGGSTNSFHSNMIPRFLFSFPIRNQRTKSSIQTMRWLAKTTILYTIVSVLSTAVAVLTYKTKGNESEWTFNAREGVRRMEYNTFLHLRTRRRSRANTLQMRPFPSQRAYLDWSRPPGNYHPQSQVHRRQNAEDCSRSRTRVEWYWNECHTHEGTCELVGREACSPRFPLL